jgi:hypothetical protein
MKLPLLNNQNIQPVTFVTAHRAESQMFQHSGIEINGVTPPALPLMDNMQVGKY